MPTTVRLKLYFAAPLFSLAERTFNTALADALKRQYTNLDVLLPQAAADDIASLPDFPKMMYDYCLQSVADCDAVLAILDGPDADSGTSLEVGYALARGKPVIGVRTDLRASEERGLNLMLSRACTDLISVRCMVTSIDDLAARISSSLSSILERRGRCSLAHP